jgi:23S rRNA pseudouridine1911/1915/1917 synthase
MNPNFSLKIVVQSSMRADLLLLGELRKTYKTISRGGLKILFQEKRIRIRGEAISASEEFFKGEYIFEIENWNPALDFSPEPAEFSPDLDAGQVSVLYEDEDFIFLNKPSGMPSAPLRTSDTGNAVSAALSFLSVNDRERFIEIGKLSGHPIEGGLLHRLDTGTSGILAFAKSVEEFRRIRALWKGNQIRKYYRALVTSDIQLLKTPFTINTALGHDAKSAKRMVALVPDMPVRKIRGSPLSAITHVLGSQFTEDHILELKLEIETGVMHQIRVHLNSVGFPILGDPIYSTPNKDFKRLMLHHERIDIPLRSSTILSVISPPVWFPKS